MNSPPSPPLSSVTGRGGRWERVLHFELQTRSSRIPPDPTMPTAFLIHAEPNDHLPQSRGAGPSRSRSRTTPVGHHRPAGVPTRGGSVLLNQIQPSTSRTDRSVLTRSRVFDTSSSRCARCPLRPHGLRDVHPATGYLFRLLALMSFTARCTMTTS
jgi:hypothetical protein